MGRVLKRRHLFLHHVTHPAKLRSVKAERRQLKQEQHTKTEKKEACSYQQFFH
jgi:hypothetical protein